MNEQTDGPNESSHLNRWDTQTIGIQQKPGNAWGISPDLLPIALKLLKEIKPLEKPGDNISFADLKLLVADLRSRPLSFTSLSSALSREAAAERDNRWPRPASMEEFKKVADRLNAGLNIQQPDDPQKFRWGAEPQTKNKKLTAAVVKSELSESFTLTITLSAPGYKGWVAFFLHTRYENPVVYQEIVDGAAHHTRDIHSAFTIGALVDDGDMLEFDLRDLNELPREFYTLDFVGFFTEPAIRAIVKEAFGRRLDSVRKTLLLFRTPAQRTWLVASENDLYIVIDDEETRVGNRFVQSTFAKSRTVPIKSRSYNLAPQSVTSEVVQFAAQVGADTWWLYSLDLFPDFASLESAISTLIESPTPP